MPLVLHEGPTPLEPLPRLATQLGEVDLWIKRDDVMGLGGGGNKIRKLEWLLQEAVDADADVVLTCGAVQSNHARLTAAACARLGLGCELWLARAVSGRPANYDATANVLLDRLFGATIHLLNADGDPELSAARRADDLRSAGRKPYLIPVGGSNVVGARGYVAGAAEILRQAAQHHVEFGAIVVACGSGGTLAGLAAGLGEAGWSGRLLGVSVSAPAEAATNKVTTLARQLTDRPAVPEIDDRFIGAGYGIPTAAGTAAVQLFARTEGILLDPVYTGKAAAALLDRLPEFGATHAGPALFVHTGGSPALFAYPEEML